jgi:TRAP-type uncharacterized transport system fused permease subunit
VFAAAGLAKTSLWQAGFVAMRVAAPAYIVPFMFVYEPTLLLIVKNWGSDGLYAAWAVVSASAGVICLAASLFGWLIGYALAWQRVLLFAAALCLIKPGVYTDLLGLGLLAVVAAAQKFAPAKETQTA